MKIPFSGRILLLGCGSVSVCFLPLLLRHLEMDFSRITVMDFLDQRHLIADTLAAGVRYVQHQITPDNLAQTLSEYVGPGDLIVDLAWNIDTGDIIQWCHDRDVMYINTSVEVWDPYEDLLNQPPTERTLYVRHMALREMAARWTQPGATAVVEHGANPGLVSHWTKVALRDIATMMLRDSVSPEKRSDLEEALAAQDYPRLAMLEDVKVIHISERDTQISNIPKVVGEFVNTWSVEGYREEGIAPAEMGWGTHERRLPHNAHVHLFGPGNQICLSQMGINTLVRSWVPTGGEIIGMIVRHGEAFTISDYLTVWDGAKPVYRPTVHYAYLPCDGAVASLLEFRMHNYNLQDKQRIMSDEIIDGADELGVLLLGHDLNGWWVGSQLDIHEARALVPGQNATTLQVAASVLGALSWMIRNPRRGFLVPDQLPDDEVLQVANRYLGPCPSLQTDWNPLRGRFDPFMNYGEPAPSDEDLWQFGTFLVE
ncbi:MAG: homospermidine synthase [Anaerolineae bacterium]|nr:homospermidine synthase [Anaerolineae bacterium]